MKFRHLSHFGALGRVFSTVEGFPSTGKGDPVTLRVQGQGEGFILQSEDSPVLWMGAILLLQPRMLLSWIRTRELGLYGTKADSMFWSLEKNSFFSLVDRLQSSKLLGIRHYLCLRQPLD